MALSADGAAVLCAAGQEVVEVATASGEVNQRWAPGSAAAALTVLSVSLGACAQPQLPALLAAAAATRQLMSNHFLCYTAYWLSPMWGLPAENELHL